MVQGPRPLDAVVWGLSGIYLPGVLSLFHHAWVCALRAVGGLTHLERIVHMSLGSRVLDCSPSLWFVTGKGSGCQNKLERQPPSGPNSLPGCSRRFRGVEVGGDFAVALSSR